jgi:hypothetical protein
MKVYSNIGDIIVLERISFQLANNRGRYSHFVNLEGSIGSLYSRSSAALAPTTWSAAHGRKSWDSTGRPTVDAKSKNQIQSPPAMEATMREDRLLLDYFATRIRNRLPIRKMVGDGDRHTDSGPGCVRQCGDLVDVAAKKKARHCRASHYQP